MLSLALLLACAPAFLGHAARSRGESVWLALGRALIALLLAEAVLASNLGEAPALLTTGDTAVRFSRAEHVGFLLLALALASFSAGWHLASRRQRRA